MHIVMVVEVVDPGSKPLGVSRLTNNSRFSLGAKLIMKTSSPAALYNLGFPPHDGALQSIDVVDSYALPRFSTINHAVAVLPGFPKPSDVGRPPGPTTDIPLVLRTSIGNLTVELMLVSMSSVKDRSTKEFSSPKASLGIPIEKSTSTGFPGIKIGFIF